MKLLLRIQKAIAIMACGCGAVAADAQPMARPAEKTIYEIKAVTLSVTDASKINVSATGTVRTAGWTDPRLIPRSSRAEKADTSDVVTLHFDFVATRPTGMFALVITPITAETTVPAPGTGKTLRVVVHSEKNEMDDSIKSTNAPR